MKFSKGFVVIVLLLLVCICGLLIYISSTQHLIVQGSSMLPTFDNETKITGLKFFGRLHRGDIVIYSPPTEACQHTEQQCLFVARIIGLPHEKLEMANYFVKINDAQIHEPYLSPDTHTLFSEKIGGVFTLKEDEYFVMGDNRPYADDSRLFGPIKKSQIQSVFIF